MLDEPCDAVADVHYSICREIRRLLALLHVTNYSLCALPASDGHPQQALRQETSTG